MRLHGRGSPRCGDIHTCLVETSVHQLHVVFTSPLGSRIIVEEGPERGSHVVPPQRPSLVRLTGSLRHVDISCKGAFSALSARLVLRRPSNRGCRATQCRLVTRSRRLLGFVNQRLQLIWRRVRHDTRREKTTEKHNGIWSRTQKNTSLQNQGGGGGGGRLVLSRAVVGLSLHPPLRQNLGYC